MGANWDNRIKKTKINNGSVNWKWSHIKKKNIELIAGRPIMRINF